MEFNEKHGEINLKMAGNGRLLVKRMKVKVLFAKILRVYGAELFRILFSVFESGKLYKNISVLRHA